MTTHRWHHPLPGSAFGDHATCGGCGQPIVFVKALDNRAAYWRVTTVRVEVHPHDTHGDGWTERPDWCAACLAEAERESAGSPA